MPALELLRQCMVEAVHEKQFNSLSVCNNTVVTVTQ